MNNMMIFRPLRHLLSKICIVLPIFAFISIQCSTAHAIRCVDIFRAESPQSRFQLPATKDAKEFWNNRENRLRYINWLEAKLGIKSQADWYKLSIQSFSKNQGTGILKVYDFNVYRMLTDLRPELNLLAWKFPKVPKDFWVQPENVRTYVKWLANELGMKSPSDWYGISTTIVRANGGQGLLHRYDSSFYKLLKDAFPEYMFLPWKFNMVPNGYWDVPTNRLRYAQWLGKQLNFKKPEDWYGLTIALVKQNHGGGLIKSRYDHSPYQMIEDIFPHFGLKPWFFPKTNSTFWSEPANIREYVLWLAERLNIKTKEDWYSVQTSAFQENSGGGLVSRYTPRDILSIAYPNFKWVPWKFTQLAPRFWHEPQNRQDYLKWLAEKLEFKEKEDWYKVTANDFHQKHGAGIFDFYRNDRIRVLREVDPEFQWQFWRFEVPLRRNLWTPENKAQFIEHMTEQLGISSLEDWYNVTAKDFESVGGKGILITIYDGSPGRAIMDLLPRKNWRPELFDTRWKSQQRMFNVLQEIYPGERMIYNYKSDSVRFDETGRKMEIDVYLPDRKVGFEYQGEQHYMPIQRFGGQEAFDGVRVRDAEKIESFRENGVTIVEVPYTWNRTKSGLEEIIREAIGE